MPIYEYECSSCCQRFEMKRGFDEGSEAECPKCRNTARRIFHPAPIIFKGSGFYVTDSRKKVEETGSDKGKTEAAPKKS